MPRPQGAGPRPNLFLVGAPKSGTTALATYLGEHPEVFMAPWELNFFGTDLSFRTATGAPSHIRLAHYLSTFSSHAGERYRGDHWSCYLYSARAAEEIRDFAPDARIVVMLRNPVDQMHSQHSEMLYQGDEDIRDFAEALDAEGDRALGRRIPPGCRKPFALQYRAVAVITTRSTGTSPPSVVSVSVWSSSTIWPGTPRGPTASSWNSWVSTLTTSRSSGW